MRNHFTVERTIPQFIPFSGVLCPILSLRGGVGGGDFIGILFLRDF
jgi:hypothetical protein